MGLLDLLWRYIDEGFGLFIVYAFAAIFLFLGIRRFHSRKGEIASGGGHQLSGVNNQHCRRKGTAVLIYGFDFDHSISRDLQVPCCRFNSITACASSATVDANSTGRTFPGRGNGSLE